MRDLGYRGWDLTKSRMTYKKSDREHSKQQEGMEEDG